MNDNSPVIDSAKMTENNPIYLQVPRDDIAMNFWFGVEYYYLTEDAAHYIIDMTIKQYNPPAFPEGSPTEYVEMLYDIYNPYNWSLEPTDWKKYFTLADWQDNLLGGTSYTPNVTIPSSVLLRVINLIDQCDDPAHVDYYWSLLLLPNLQLEVLKTMYENTKKAAAYFDSGASLLRLRGEYEKLINAILAYPTMLAHRAMEAGLDATLPADWLLELLSNDESTS